MNYNELKLFLTKKMRMSHIYQPVMIKKLLASNGAATDEAIATQLLQYDPSQLEYYQSITNNMVGKVLRSHAIVTKNKNEYALTDFERMGKEEIDELIKICNSKIDAYIQKRGDAIWQHRRTNRNAISGTIRYEVLKRAHFHCELCGISADERALEVDHINPVAKGGEDGFHNYQALCYVCNASKRDRDDTDFRNQQEKFAHRKEDCLFCKPEGKRIVEENSLAYLIEDKYPVTHGHSLIIPKRHFASYFDITQPELNSIQTLLQYGKERLQKKDGGIEGFNIGVNSGEVAGQTIFHTHVHLIPRRQDDVADPTGGVRNVITGKGKYK